MFRHPLAALVLSFVACAGSPAPLQGPLAWNFDDVAPGALPAGFTVDATRRVGPLATWDVGPAADARSGRNVLSLSYPNHKSYDSFNLCWNPAVGFGDGVITVQVCARSGKEDQGGGVQLHAARAARRTVRCTYQRCVGRCGLPVPLAPLPALVGFRAFAQGWSLGAAGLVATNGVDVTIGR